MFLYKNDEFSKYFFVFLSDAVEYAPQECPRNSCKKLAAKSTSQRSEDQKFPQSQKLQPAVRGPKIPKASKAPAGPRPKSSQGPKIPAIS